MTFIKHLIRSSLIHQIAHNEHIILLVRCIALVK